MQLEIVILNALLDSYERSKVSKGQNKVKKDIKVDVTHRIFDNHRNHDNGELEIALKQIEREGYGSIIYTRDGQFQSVLLNLDSDCIERLYTKLKRENPSRKIEEYLEFFLNKTNGCLIVKNFCEKMLSLLEDKKLSSVEQYFSSLNDLNDICSAIEAMSVLEEDVQERIFCAKHFSNSKRFIELRGKISKIIKEFSDEPFDDEDDVIARMGVIKNTSYAFIKGNLKLKINNQIIDLKEYKEPLALSDSAIKNIEILEVGSDSLFTIENLTSFDVFNVGNEIAIYLGGFHNSVKRDLIKKIYEAKQNILCFHYGDIDAGGFYILNHLRIKTGINFQAYMMGISELEKNKSRCRQLTENDKKRLLQMRENKYFEEFKIVFDYMLENNTKLEQEAEI